MDPEVPEVPQEQKEKEKSKKPCKFGANCKNKDTCQFDHTDQVKKCRNGSACKKKSSCTFEHNCQFGMKCSKRDTCIYDHQEPKRSLPSYFCTETCFDGKCQKPHPHFKYIFNIFFQYIF